MLFRSRAKDAFSKNDNFIKGVDDYFFKNWDVLPSSALIEGGSEAATGDRKSVV